MGMTDKQFNGFIRFLLNDIKEVDKLLKNGSKDEAEQKLQEITDNLQKTIED